jgi:hypothetical protein
MEWVESSPVLVLEQRSGTQDPAGDVVPGVTVPVTDSRRISLVKVAND